MRRYFTKLFGNEATKNRISLSIESGKLPHALLIDGEEGSGRFTLALQIAAALNCENRHNNSHPLPCGVCNSCQRVYSLGFADLSVLEREKGKANIGVDEVREFRKDMYLSATESEHKIYIIREAERMTPEAQNALLIVLEEPPPKVLIILITAGTDKLLSTINSRVQYIAMSRFTTDEIDSYLSSNHPTLSSLKRTSPDRYKGILVGADGRIGRALALAEPKASMELENQRESIISFVKSLRPKVPYGELYGILLSLPKDRVELTEMLEGIIVALRDLVALRRGIATDMLFFTDRREAEIIAKEIGLQRLLKIYDIVIDTQRECAKFANNSLLITNMGLKIKLA